jgi:thioredoxin 1
MAKPFALMAIPTQVLYDRQGKEVFRHVGFLGKKALVEQLDTYLAVK